MLRNPRPQTPIYELRKIARVELDSIPVARQLATCEDENGLVTIRPPQALGFKAQRSFVGSRTHDITIDRLEERLNESRIHGIPANEFVCDFHPA